MIVAEAVFMGVLATLLADAWHLVLKKLAKLPVANWAVIGRWVAWFFRGVVCHQDIMERAPVRGERLIGWVFHYVIGIIYGGIYLLIMQTGLGLPPTLLSALVFGMVTIIAPWFVMQPALGMGIMAIRTPDARIIRIVSVSTHMLFGVGLYLADVVYILVGI